MIGLVGGWRLAEVSPAGSSITIACPEDEGDRTVDEDKVQRTAVHLGR